MYDSNGESNPFLNSVAAAAELNRIRGLKIGGKDYSSWCVFPVYFLNILIKEKKKKE